jgi:hypothetical protein
MNIITKSIIYLSCFLFGAVGKHLYLCVKECFVNSIEEK